MSKQPRPDAAEWPAGAIFTVGHSNLLIDRFVALLKAFAIQTLADIRTVPKSRRNPQFGAGALAESLAARQIDYVAMPALGGLRRPLRNSPNGAWRNESFRGYADYMQTPAFQEAVDRLVDVSRRSRVAIMCAEAVPWRCHRSLVADALEARGVPVVEILSETNYRFHVLTPFARVDGRCVTYPDVGVAAPAAET